MSKQKGNTKYSLILKEGQKLFWKHGVTRVTVEEICEKAHVSKRTYYKHFSNKKELAKVILERIVEKNQKTFEALVRADQPFAEKAREMILLKFRSSEGISTEFITDIYRNEDLGLTGYIREQSERSQAMFARLIEQARENGEIRQGVGTAFVLEYLNKLAEMTGNNELMNQYHDTRELIMEGIEFMFYGLGLAPEKQ